MPRIKEITYFSRENTYKKGPQWYERQFRGWNREKAVAEASTAYMYFHKVPERIHALLPNAKFIFILRNPVERAFSNYLREGEIKGETRSFETILEQDFERFLFAGRYFAHIERFLEYFEKRKIFVLFFEDLKDNRDSTLSNIGEFLEIDREGFSQQNVKT